MKLITLQGKIQPANFILISRKCKKKIKVSSKIRNTKIQTFSTPIQWSKS